MKLCWLLEWGAGVAAQAGRRRLGFLSCVALAAIGPALAATQPALGAEAQAGARELRGQPQRGGYSVPSYGERTEIKRLYSTSDGHLIAGFTYLDNGKLHSDFYDFVARRRLAPELSDRVASDGKLKAEVVTKFGLRSMLPVSSLRLRGGATVAQTAGPNASCEWPFAAALTVNYADGRRSDYMIFERLSKPVVREYVRACQNINISSVRLSLHYVTRYAPLYVGPSGEFLALIQESPYVMILNSSARDGVSANFDNITVLPAQVFEKIRGDADRYGADQQSYVDKAEQMVANVAANVVGGAK